MARISKAPEERRQEIINTAARLFSKKGVDETSVNEIVRKVGVAQGLFYYYFKSKDELIEAVCDLYAERIIAMIEKKVYRKDLRAIEKLKVFFSMTEETEVRENRNIVEYIHDMRRSSLHQEIAVKTLNKFVDMFVHIINQGIDEGVFKVKNPEVTAQIILVGFGRLQDSVQIDTDPKKLTVWADGALDLLKRMLGITIELKITDIFPKSLLELYLTKAGHGVSHD